MNGSSDYFYDSSPDKIIFVTKLISTKINERFFQYALTKNPYTPQPDILYIYPCYE